MGNIIYGYFNGKFLTSYIMKFIVAIYDTPSIYLAVRFSPKES